MMVLWEQYQLTLSDIGRRLFLDSATLTPLLKRMEAAGLVTRLRAEQDERQVIVGLTRAGRELQQKAAQVPVSVLCATACAPDDLSSEEHTSELQSLMRTSYAVFCLKKE